ncbi:hypothetical protein [Nocardia sp. 348MFTsu5.1]|uniref:hypothetical protein n=1 Tax=Nocardia sp. 348MFTsu5.1 TaxID=1172185 RepID=UPI00037B6C86|nr:hypothetical protein [Nocardia sp. 348MFTsu5.1]
MFTSFTPHVWSAEEGVDLFGRGPELVRATTEAGFYWPAVAEIDDYFPGFTAALETEHEPFALARWDHRAEYLRPLNETFFLHIADYSEAGSVVSATVCSYMLHSTPGLDDADPPASVDRIVLENAGETAGLPGVVDRDPDHGSEVHRSPSWNVFGSWKIRLGRSVFGGTERSPREDGLFVPQECRDWWLQQFPGLMQPDPDSPYQQQPPGFVAPVMPVGVQYPGWIGPSNVA